MHIILNEQQLRQKITRIAYEIYENNLEQTDNIVLVGIADSGYSFAALLQKELENLTKQNTPLFKITLDKNAPSQSQVQLEMDLKMLNNKVVVIADDVLNTGRTLAYSLAPFLTIPLAKLQIAVIINRDHRTFPISPDYVGYAMATTIQNHVVVQLTETEMNVRLEMK